MTTSEARKRREELVASMSERHKWELHISAVGRDRVICNHCGKVFIPDVQTMIYTGKVPSKYQ